MGPQDITNIVQQMILVSLEISAPILIVTLFVGLLISIFMSVTQISETSLIFVPKLVGFAVTLVLCFPWMLKILIKFTNEMLITQWNNIAAFNY